MDSIKEDKYKSPWEWAKSACAVLIAIALCIKIYQTPTTISIDFPTLLSLLLALFSVGLSALFYFKATDTSNTFYDNTYKFTKDIAQLLVKIESGFGEKLKHLDEGYSSMRNYLQGFQPNKTSDIKKTEEKIESEQQEIEKLRAERNNLIKQIIERSQLQEAEKIKITNELKNKEQELTHMHEEMSKLNRRLAVERVLRKNAKNNSIKIESGFESYTFDRVIKKIGAEEVLNSSPKLVKAEFDEIAGSLPRGYIDDLESRGYFDDGLTLSGAKFLKMVAENNNDLERA